MLMMKLWPVIAVIDRPSWPYVSSHSLKTFHSRKSGGVISSMNKGNDPVSFDSINRGMTGNPTDHLLNLPSTYPYIFERINRELTGTPTDNLPICLVPTRIFLIEYSGLAPKINLKLANKQGYEPVILGDEEDYRFGYSGMGRPRIGNSRWVHQLKSADMRSLY